MIWILKFSQLDQVQSLSRIYNVPAVPTSPASHVTWAVSTLTPKKSAKKRLPPYLYFANVYGIIDSASFMRQLSIFWMGGSICLHIFTHHWHFLFHKKKLFYSSTGAYSNIKDLQCNHIFLWTRTHVLAIPFKNVAYENLLSYVCIESVYMILFITRDVIWDRETFNDHFIVYKILYNNHFMFALNRFTGVAKYKEII